MSKYFRVARRLHYPA